MKDDFFSVNALIVAALILSIVLVGYNAFLLPQYEPVSVSYRRRIFPRRLPPPLTFMISTLQPPNSFKTFRASVRFWRNVSWHTVRKLAGFKA